MNKGYVPKLTKRNRKHILSFNNNILHESQDKQQLSIAQVYNPCIACADFTLHTALFYFFK